MGRSFASLAVAVAVAFAQPACKSNTMSSGPQLRAKKEAAGAEKKAWAYPADAQQKTDHFNLAAHIKGSAEASDLHKFVQEGFAGLGFGDRGKVRVETNLTSDVLGDSDAGDKGIVAHYNVDIFAANQKFGGGGSLVDYQAIGRADNPSAIDAHMRFLGDDKVANADGVIDERFMRDVGLTVPVVPLPPAQIILQLKVGGELGLKTQLGVRLDRKMQLLFVPEVDLILTIGGGVRLFALVDGKAEGQIKMLAMKPALSANVGFDPAFVYGNNSVHSGGINAIDGKIDLVVDLGYKGFLPGGLDAIAMKKGLEALGYGKIANGKQWRWNVFNPEPVLNNSIPHYLKPIIAFPAVPGSRTECLTASQSVGPVLKGHLTDLNTFVGTLEGEAKDITEKSAQLLSQTQSRVAAFCD